MFSSKNNKFDGNKCKVHLKMLVNRFKLLEAKKANLNKQANRHVAGLLSEGKSESARIQVEHIIREDYTVEAYEALRQHVEVLLARFNVVVSETEPRKEIQESLCTLIYAGWLLGSDMPELKTLLDQFTVKYGQPFVDEVTRNSALYINPRVLAKLNHDIPERSLVDTYLVEIARAHHVDWAPSEPLGATQAGGGGVPKGIDLEELAALAAADEGAATTRPPDAAPAGNGPPNGAHDSDESEAHRGTHASGGPGETSDAQDAAAPGAQQAGDNTSAADPALVAPPAGAPASDLPTPSSDPPAPGVEPARASRSAALDELLRGPDGPTSDAGKTVAPQQPRSSTPSTIAVSATTPPLHANAPPAAPPAPPPAQPGLSVKRADPDDELMKRLAALKGR